MYKVMQYTSYYRSSSNWILLEGRMGYFTIPKFLARKSTPGGCILLYRGFSGASQRHSTHNNIKGGIHVTPFYVTLPTKCIKLPGGGRRLRDGTLAAAQESCSTLAVAISTHPPSHANYHGDFRACACVCMS